LLIPDTKKNITQFDRTESNLRACPLIYIR
jgi:hypothetical protein